MFGNIGTDSNLMVFVPLALIVAGLFFVGIMSIIKAAKAKVECDNATGEEKLRFEMQFRSQRTKAVILTLVAILVALWMFAGYGKGRQVSDAYTVEDVKASQPEIVQPTKQELKADAESKVDKELQIVRDENGPAKVREESDAKIDEILKRAEAINNQ